MAAKLSQAEAALREAGFRLFRLQENGAGLEVTIVGTAQDRVRAYAIVRGAIGNRVPVVIIY